MQGTTEATKDIGPGSIMQVAPAESGDIAMGPDPAENPIDRRHLQLLIVETKETWGITARLADNTIVRLAWSHVEPTGGRIIWAPDGNRVAPLPAGIKHHE